MAKTSAECISAFSFGCHSQLASRGTWGSLNSVRDGPATAHQYCASSRSPSRPQRGGSQHGEGPPHAEASEGGLTLEKIQAAQRGIPKYGYHRFSDEEICFVQSITDGKRPYKSNAKPFTYENHGGFEHVMQLLAGHDKLCHKRKSRAGYDSSGRSLETPDRFSIEEIEYAVQQSTKRLQVAKGGEHLDREKVLDLLAGSADYHHHPFFLHEIKYAVEMQELRMEISKAIWKQHGDGREKMYEMKDSDAAEQAQRLAEAQETFQKGQKLDFHTVLQLIQHGATVDEIRFAKKYEGKERLYPFDKILALLKGRNYTFPMADLDFAFRIEEIVTHMYRDRRLPSTPISHGTMSFLSESDKKFFNFQRILDILSGSSGTEYHRQKFKTEEILFAFQMGCSTGDKGRDFPVGVDEILRLLSGTSVSKHRFTMDQIRLSFEIFHSDANKESDQDIQSEADKVQAHKGQFISNTQGTESHRFSHDYILQLMSGEAMGYNWYQFTAEEIRVGLRGGHAIEKDPRAVKARALTKERVLHLISGTVPEFGHHKFSIEEVLGCVGNWQRVRAKAPHVEYPNVDTLLGLQSGTGRTFATSGRPAFSYADIKFAIDHMGKIYERSGAEPILSFDDSIALLWKHNSYNHQFSREEIKFAIDFVQREDRERGVSLSSLTQQNLAHHEQSYNCSHNGNRRGGYSNCAGGQTSRKQTDAAVLQKGKTADALGISHPCGQSSYSDDVSFARILNLIAGKDARYRRPFSMEEIELAREYVDKGQFTESIRFLYDLGNGNIMRGIFGAEVRLGLMGSSCSSDKNRIDFHPIDKQALKLLLNVNNLNASHGLQRDAGSQVDATSRTELSWQKECPTLKQIIAKLLRRRQAQDCIH